MDGDRDAELGALDATAQAALVRSGGATPLELVEAACRRIERVDPLLGAVPVRLFDAARESGLRPGGDALAPALAGVPFLMKDVGARQAGQPYYAGNRALRDSDHRAETDTPLGALFREIGLVTVGNSSTPEFGLQSHTWPLAYGPTRNPYDLERAAGGSSGGACAAVAAGLVPVAHASDGAGSIRIPAAWCGLVGLKPSRDRVTWRHAGLELPEVEFVVARSLRDTALLLDLLRADRATAPADAFRAALVTPTGARRVGLLLRSPAGSPVAPECAAAVLQAGEGLARAGHRVERAAPPSLDEYADRALHGAVLGNAEYRACLDDLAARLGRPVGPGDVEPFLWELSRGTHAAATPAELETSVAWSHAWVARTLAWFDAYDLLLTPTVCEPAPRLETLDPHRLAPLEMLERMVPHMAFTEPWNATGQPAITLPLAETADGLPVGVQLVAAPGREDLLLRLSQTLLSSRGEIPRPPHHA